MVVTASGAETAKSNTGATLKHDLLIGSEFLLEKAVYSYARNATTKILVVRHDVVDSMALQRISNSDPDMKIQYLAGETEGALCTALMSVDHIDMEIPIFIVPGDSFISEDVPDLLKAFLESDAEAGTLLFQGVGERWSYARLNSKLQLLEMAEKIQISNAASTGVFYFRSGLTFVKAAEWVLLNNMRTNGEFYVSAAINYLTLSGKKVLGVYLQNSQNYFPLSTPEDIETARSKIEKI